MNNSFDQALKLIEKKLAQNLDEGTKEVFTWFKNIITAFKTHSNPEEQSIILKGDLLRMVREEKFFIIEKLEKMFEENFLEISEEEKRKTINFLLNLISEKIDFKELDKEPEAIEPESLSTPAEESASTEEAEESIEDVAESEETISFDVNSSDIDEVISADIINKYNEETEMLYEIIALNERMMTRENISERSKSVLQNRIKLARKWLDYYDEKYELMAHGSREYLRKNASINTQEPILKGGFKKYFVRRRSRKIDKKKAEIDLLKEDERNLRTKLANDNYNKYSLKIRLEKLSADIERLKAKKGKLELKQRKIVNKKIIKQLKEMQTNRYEVLAATKKLDRVHSEEDKIKKDISIKTIKLREITDKDRSEITDEERVIKKELVKRIKKLQKQKSSLSRDFKFQLVGQNFLFKLVGKSKPKKEKPITPPPPDSDLWTVFEGPEGSDESYEEDFSLMPPTPPSSPIVESPREEILSEHPIDSSIVTETPALEIASEPIITDGTKTDSETLLHEEPIERHRRADKNKELKPAGMRIISPEPTKVEDIKVETSAAVSPSTPIINPELNPSKSIEPPTPGIASEPIITDGAKSNSDAILHEEPIERHRRVDLFKKLRDDLENYQRSTSIAQDPNLPGNEIVNNVEDGPSHSM